MTTRIEALEVHDDEALRRWYDVYLEADTAGRPYATPWMYEEIRAAVQAPPVATRRLLLSAYDEGRLVGVAEAVLPLKDNVDTADLRVHVLPGDRRRGHGTRLLAALEEAVRPRSVVTAETDFAYDLGPSGRGDATVEFLLARGFELALVDVQRTLRLPVPAARLGDLAKACAPHHRGYELRAFTGPVPDELLHSYGRLVGTLVTEAPTGELTLEDELHDEERIRSDERRLEQAGRRRYVTVALDAHDDVVGFTEIAVPTHHPGRAYQQGTLVRPDHRGHRLGVALKAANHLVLQEAEPSLTEVVTYNAEVNAAMIGVNEQLGYEPTARMGEFQKRLTR